MELKCLVMKLNSDLTAVGYQDNLTNNPYILGEIVPMMPRRYQHKFSEYKSVADDSKTLWEVTCVFLYIIILSLSALANLSDLQSLRTKKVHSVTTSS